LDEAFIVVSVVSGIFGLIGIELLSHNWFKKERFKIQASNIKKQNDLQIKKMAKELGVNISRNASKAGAPPLGSISSLVDIAKQLSPEQLGSIVSTFTGGAPELELEPPEEEDTGINHLIEFAKKNPELVKGFMSKMPQLTEGGETETGWI